MAGRESLDFSIMAKTSAALLLAFYSFNGVYNAGQNTVEDGDGLLKALGKGLAVDNVSDTWNVVYGVAKWITERDTEGQMGLDIDGSQLQAGSAVVSFVFRA